MRDHHVSVGAGLLVESGSLAEAQLLRHVDLHVIDEVAVPDGLEQPVGEAERKNILRRLLAEEVVDAEDLLFVEDLVQPGIQRDRARRDRCRTAFSMMTRERSTKPASPSRRTADSAAFGGTLR